MTLSSRDIEKARRNSSGMPWFTGGALFLVRLIKTIPYLRRKIEDSIGGLSGTIFRYQHSDDYLNATRTAIYALEKYRHRKGRFIPEMMHHHWWSFMRHAVESASHIDDHELKEKLIDYAEHGIEPFEGNYVAVAFLEFARWRYREGNHDKAIEYARLAAAADKTWAEPEFILGWFGLVMSTGDAEEHLSRAIKIDRRILFRVVNNDICKQYPAIIRKLKERYKFAEDETDTEKYQQTEAAKPGR